MKAGDGDLETMPPVRTRPILRSWTPEEERLLRRRFGVGVAAEELPHPTVVLNRLTTQNDEVGDLSPVYWRLQRKQDSGSTPPATACPPMIPLFRKP